MKSSSCVCLSTRYSSDMESPIPRDIGFNMDGDRTRPALKRKGSTLQTSVEVLRCKFGKPATTTETAREFSPSKQWSPIMYAVYHQREAALSHFLRAGESPDDVHETGQPPLCIAVANGYVEVVKILLEAGADLDATTKNGGETALHLAVKNGHSDVIDLIMAYEPNLEAKTYETCETPLHYAASKSGSLATVITLLKFGAKYDAQNVKGQTPAEAALQANNIHGAVAIINAAHGKRNKLVKEKEMLLKHVQKTQGRFSIDNDLIADIFSAACDPESTVLVEAIKRNDVGLVEMFLEKGSDPDRETAKGLRPIFVALDCAGAPVVQALIKHHADVSVRNKNGLTVLQVALEGSLAQEKDVLSPIFGALIERGANAMATYADGKTLLHHAISPSFSHTKVANLLIKAGVKINAQDNDGNTALHIATHSKLCIDMLLKNGANSRLENLNGLTPLLYATTYCRKDGEPDLESLIKTSDLRQTNQSGQTALHLAAMNNLEKTVRLLIRVRGDTATVDSDKNTPLLLAVKSHQWSIVPLLTIPPNINSWDADGISALHHISSSEPKAPSTWKDIAAAIAPFCDRGVSRSMRDRSGATPLIRAVKMLPQEGLPVVKALLVERKDRGTSWNCVSHEDHKKHDALYYAATMDKPVFVEALLKYGAVFNFQDWVQGNNQLGSSAESNAQILKLFAQYEWSHRVASLRRQSNEPDIEAPVFSEMFPTKDLKQMIAMGLDVNALPKSPLGTSLLWAILRHIPMHSPMSPKYVVQTVKLVLEAGADPNAETTNPSQSRESKSLALHPLTFVLEECLTVGIELVTLLLTKDTKLSVGSPFYSGRYPLHSAVKANRIDLVEELLSRCADVDCKDQSGRTPLFIAAESGYRDIMEALLHRGAKVDLYDTENSTPLHAAAVGGSKTIVAILLRAGAKANVKNKEHLTPLACVAEALDEKEKSKIVPMLKDAEEKERRNEEHQHKQAEQLAAYAAKTKQLKAQEEESKARQRKQQEEEEAETLRQKAQEAKAQRHKEEEEEKQQRIIQTTQPVITSPSPQNPPPRKSFLRKSSLFFFSKHKSTPSPTPIISEKPPMLTLHQETSLSTTQAAITTTKNTPDLLASPDFFATKGADATSSVSKPLQHRVDSGVGARLVEERRKKRGTLDLELVNEKLVAKRESGGELGDWLVMSRLLDEL